MKCNFVKSKHQKTNFAFSLMQLCPAQGLQDFSKLCRVVGAVFGFQNCVCNRALLSSAVSLRCVTEALQQLHLLGCYLQDTSWGKAEVCGFSPSQCCVPMGMPIALRWMLLCLEPGLGVLTGATLCFIPMVMHCVFFCKRILKGRGIH